ncbi:MAG TPA: hypothetical protein VNG71_15540 [Pyrinomonadaceae bacterium]|nr:hypothetical protein [Pyrinomonadaceae bacterium]
MLPVSVSKPIGYFVGRFFPVSPNAENLVVRYFGLRGLIDFLFKMLKFLNYFRGSLGIGNTETAPHLEWQFNNNLSHGAKTPFRVRIVSHELNAFGWAS